jgi:hypothetical protein
MSLSVLIGHLISLLTHVTPSPNVSCGTILGSIGFFNQSSVRSQHSHSRLLAFEKRLDDVKSAQSNCKAIQP